MQFNENERKLINTYVKDFSIANASNILEFGRIIESKISIINDIVLNKTKSKETSRIEELIKTITNEILKINQTQKKLKIPFLSIARGTWAHLHMAGSNGVRFLHCVTLFNQLISSWILHCEVKMLILQS